MHYIAEDLETEDWVTAGLVRLERYLARGPLVTEPSPADAPGHIDDDLGCLDIVGLVTDYLGNALPAEDRRKFEHHLTACSGCVTYVDRLRETTPVPGRLPREEPLARALRERLVSQFRSWKWVGMAFQLGEREEAR